MNEARNSIRRMEEEVSQRRPVLADLLQRHGDESLQTYTERFFDYEADPVQPAEDLIEVAGRQARVTLGEEVALKLERRLRRHPVILTANHHGPDFLSFTAQGSVLFSLPEGPDSVVPVLAFGGVPLNNLTWPRGIWVGDGRRVNVFPNRLRASLVGVTEPFDRQMVERALGRLEGGPESEAIRSILEQEYLAPEVLESSSYSRQSTLLNRRLWVRTFSDEADAHPEMAYLEIEVLVAELLSRDILDPATLMHRVLCTPGLRQAVLKSLDGCYGCWKRNQLEALQNPSLDGSARRELSASAGTMFFWGIDSGGRRIPLLRDRNGVLRGVGDSGEAFAHSFEPDALISGLASHRIYPSLFTVFASVAFARGFRCYGGFMQADYLTEMKDGLAEAILEAGEGGWSERVKAVPTENYVTGMIFAVTKDAKGVRPSGTVDVLAEGGLSAASLKQIRNDITVETASLMGLPDIYRVVCRGELDPSLIGITPEQVSEHVGDELVVLGCGD